MLFGDCDYQAATPIRLKKHIAYKHKGIVYTCEQCDYQAATLFSVKQHVNSEHEGIKYACDQCDFKGTLPSILFRRHVNS